MINTIIFSRKRPMQLWALLESLPDFVEPHILFKIDDDYAENYTKVMQKFPFDFIKEVNFEQDTRKLLQTKHATTMFLTDDCVFFRQPHEPPPIERHETFSFRYGINTTLQNHVTNQHQINLNLYTDYTTHIGWDTSFYMYPCNYSYSIALDGHIFSSCKLRELCDRIHWTSTNQLEGCLQQFRGEIPIIKSHHHSSLVSIPTNNLSQITMAGAFHANSVEELNNLFSQGKRIDIDKTFENINIIGSHQEIELKFKDS